MLGEKDLVFLGACLLLNSESNKHGLHYLDNRDIVEAIKCSQIIFNNIFNDESKDDEKLILE